MSGAVGMVAEGRGIVGSVPEGMLIEGTLGEGSVNDGRLIEPRLPDGIIGAGIVAEGRPIVGRLADGTLGAAIVTEGVPIEPRLPKGTLGAISDGPVGALGSLLSPAKIVGVDAVCPAGTLMGVDVLMGIPGIEAIWIGLAAMRRGERRKEGRMVWRMVEDC